MTSKKPLRDSVDGSYPRHSCPAGRRAFSLIELLMVVAITVLLSGMLIPAVAGIQGTHKRKKAAILLMETLEQARLAAQQSGQKVVVIFAKSSNTTEGDDAVLIVGEPPLGAASTNLIVTTRWMKLPSGVCFRSAANTLATSSLPDLIAPSLFPPLSGTPAFSCVIFNSAGQIEYPSDRPLKLALFEGGRQDGQEQIRHGDPTAGAATEVISLARFTGRAQFNISSL